MQFIKSAFIALALFSTIGGTTASTKRNTDILSGTVYICTGPKARKYHSNPNCRGLNRCSGSIKKPFCECGKVKRLYSMQDLL